jgi:epoxyqueuosine reductase
MKKLSRPDITFIPISTDAGKIEFFGTLMPALMLLKASPLKYLQFQIAGLATPKADIETFITAGTEDATRVGDVLIFVHKWDSLTFDPFTFARARTFLSQLERLLHRAGYQADPLTPLSPKVNLPKFAAQAGLGNLSPYGLLVHPRFGPRVILSGMRTDAPFTPRPRWGLLGCNDCMACVLLCPQKPLESGIVNLGECQTCAKCLVVCPTGKGRRVGV